MKFLKFIFLIFLAFSPIATLHAVDKPLLKGQAQMTWVARHKIYRMDQAVVIKSPSEARFEALDDFGNTLLQLTFTGDEVNLGSQSVSEKKFKRYLSLPLSQEELIAALLHEVPEGKNYQVIRDGKGRVTTVVKDAKRRRDRYRVDYSSFAKVGGRSFPKTVTILSTKSKLQFVWDEVKVF